MIVLKQENALEEFDFLKNMSINNFSKSLLKKLNQTGIKNNLYINMKNKKIQLTIPKDIANSYIKLCHDKTISTEKEIFDMIDQFYSRIVAIPLLGKLTLKDTNVLFLLKEEEIVKYLSNEKIKIYVQSFLLHNADEDTKTYLFEITQKNSKTMFPLITMFLLTKDIHYLLDSPVMYAYTEAYEFNALIELNHYHQQEFKDLFTIEQIDLIKSFFTKKIIKYIEKTRFSLTFDQMQLYDENIFSILNIFNELKESQNITFDGYTVFNYNKNITSAFKKYNIISFNSYANIDFEKHVQHLYDIFNKNDDYILLVKDDLNKAVQDFILLLRKEYNDTLETGNYTSLKKFKKEYKYVLTSINEMKGDLA